MADTAKDIAEKTLSRQASEKRLERHRRLTLLRVGVLVCFFLALLLFLACLQIGRIPVRKITFEGNVHYDSAQLQTALGVRVGDPLYGFDTEMIADALLSACPYLKSAEISVSLSGEVCVHVDERVALWGLLCEGETAPSDGKYLLLDEQMLALEYTDSADHVCTVSYGGLALPGVGQTLDAVAKRAQKEYEAWLDEQKDEPNEKPPAYALRAEYLTDKLVSLASCYDDMTASDAPASLDLTDEYECVLTLRDGTVCLLGAAENIPELLSRAFLALSKYRAQQGQMTEDTTLTVDVSDPLRVLITQNRRQE